MTALPFIIIIINDHLPRRLMPIILLASVPIVIAVNQIKSNQMEEKASKTEQAAAGNLRVALSSQVGIACKPCIEALCDGRLALPLGVCRRSGDVDWWQTGRDFSTTCTGNVPRRYCLQFQYGRYMLY